MRNIGKDDRGPVLGFGLNTAGRGVKDDVWWGNGYGRNRGIGVIQVRKMGAVVGINGANRGLSLDR